MSSVSSAAPILLAQPAQSAYSVSRFAATLSLTAIR
jgi:hypothetical protein